MNTTTTEGTAMNVKAAINNRQNFARQGYGVVQIHGENCRHTNLAALEVVYEGDNGPACGYPNAVEYVVALLDGTLDDGVVNFEWRAKIMPCA